MCQDYPPQVATRSLLYMTVFQLVTQGRGHGAQGSFMAARATKVFLRVGKATSEAKGWPGAATQLGPLP